MIDPISHTRPEVSVILSTYNGQKDLEEAIRSVLDQSFTQLEFIVVDDGSKDQTVEILDQIAQQDSRLKIHKNPVNRGTGYCYSFLLSQARGEYIAAIGQDDRWERNFLEVSIAALKSHPEAAVSFSQVTIIDSQGKPNRNIHSPFLMDLAATLSREDLMCFLIKHNFLSSTAALLRRKLIEGWNTLGDNDQLQDWNTWQYLILKGDFHFIPTPLINYRIHENNLSFGGHSPTQVQVEIIQTRIEMISSKAFAQFISSHAKSNDLFYGSMKSYSETLKANTLEAEVFTQYFILLQALRRNEDVLRHLTSFQDVMAMLFLFTGSFTKSRRYSTKPQSSMECPPLFWKAFAWKYIVFIPRKDLIPSPSPFIKIRKFGPFLLVKVLVRKSLLSTLSFRIDRKAKSLELLVERHLSNQSFSWKQKLNTIRSKLKNDDFATIVSSIRKRVFG